MSDEVLDGVAESVGFVFTDDMEYRAKMASVAGASVSLALSLFIILASAWIYSVPSARHHLDRVSFRLLLWSMVAEVVYSILYLYLFTDPLTPTENPTSCGAAFYLFVGSMGAANWLCTFIGVNLMLAICFGMNPVRARLERWYIAASLLLSFGVALIPAALGHFGVDTVYESCYFTNTDDFGRIRDFVLDLYLWQILSSFVAAGCVLTVLITLFRQSRATGNALFFANDLNNPSHSHAPAARRSLSSIIFRKKNPSRLHHLEDKLTTIALKISLYPLALIVINCYITAVDLAYTVKGDLTSQGDYIAYTIYYFLYGGRGLFFALLGIFVDPCLRRGLPAACRATFRRTNHVLPLSSSSNSQEAQAHDQSLSDFLSSATPGETSPSWQEPIQVPDDTVRAAADCGRSRRPRRGLWAWARSQRHEVQGCRVVLEERLEEKSDLRPKGEEGGADLDFPPDTPIFLTYPSASENEVTTFRPPSPAQPAHTPPSTLPSITLSQPSFIAQDANLHGRSSLDGQLSLPAAGYRNGALLDPRRSSLSSLSRYPQPAIAVQNTITSRRSSQVLQGRTYAELRTQL